MNIALIGYGKMGKMIEKIALTLDHVIVTRIDSSEEWDLEAISRADICIEFTQPSSVLKNIQKLAALKKNVVIGTTGWYEELPKVDSLVKEHKIGALYSPNFSIGVQLFLNLLKNASALINRFEEYDVAGIEYHHNKKRDLPAGTALEMAQIIEQNMPRIAKCPFASVRCGSMPGTYTLLFDSPFDTITLTHESKSRESYAKGALQAAEWLLGKEGLYTFDACMEEARKEPTKEHLCN